MSETALIVLAVLVVAGLAAAAWWYAANAEKRADRVIEEATKAEIVQRNDDVKTGAVVAEVVAEEMTDDEALDRFQRRAGSRGPRDGKRPSPK